MIGIVDAISLINKSLTPVVIEVIREAVAERMRIETHIRMVSEEERPSGTGPNFRLDSKVRRVVGIGCSDRRPRPSVG